MFRLDTCGVGGDSADHGLHQPGPRVLCRRTQHSGTNSLYSTICPRRLGQFYIVISYIDWVKLPGQTVTLEMYKSYQNLILIFIPMLYIVRKGKIRKIQK